MKALKLSILSGMMLTAGLTTVKAQTADEIIQKHIDAIGGTDTWNKITSIKRVGSMSIQGMDIGYTQTVVNDKGMRTDISAMGMNGYIIVTPKEGWMYMPMQGMDKVTPIPPEQMKMFGDKLNTKASMIADKSGIAKSEYVGKDTINNVPCLKVKITDNDGNVQTDFFEASTYYLLRTEMTAKTADGEQEAAVSFSDFKKQPEGIVIPMTMTSPMGVGDITVKSVEINKPVSDDMFKPTASAATDKK
jgi:hypothetical protein